LSICRGTADRPRRSAAAVARAWRMRSRARSPPSASLAHLVGHSMGGGIAAVLALRRPDLVASLSLIASAGLGPEINGPFIEGFVRVARRREAVENLNLLVHNPALISRVMV